jgi:replicative DNA helicase
MYPAAFLERHASWENGLKEVGNIQEVIIAKQHTGLIGVGRLSFNQELTRFTGV